MLWWFLLIFKIYTFYHGLQGFKWCGPSMLPNPYYAILSPIRTVPQAGQAYSSSYWRNCEPEMSIAQIFTGFKVTCCLFSKAFPDHPVSDTIIFPLFVCTFFHTIIFYFFFAFIIFFSGLHIAYVLIISWGESWEYSRSSGKCSINICWIDYVCIVRVSKLSVSWVTY